MEKRMRSVLKFDGVKDAVTLGKKPEFKISRDLTIAAWVFVEKQTMYAGIVSKVFDTGYSESGYGLLLNGKTGVLLAIKPPTVGNTITYLQSHGMILPLQEWHHVAATYDGREAVFYLDGEKVSTAAFVTDAIYDDIDNSLMLGAFKDDNEFYPFQGKIAEVAIWNVAQTPEQLRSHMLGGTTGSEDHLVGSWSIDEGDGEVIGDKSPHASQGTITGAQWEQLAAPLESPNQKAEREKVEQQAAAKAEQQAAQHAEELNKHGDYESRLGENNQRIAKLQEELTTKISSQDARISELENRLAQCGDCCAKLAAAQAMIAELGTQLAALRKKLDPEDPRVAATVTPDDLTRIEGIGPKISELLANAGILTFGQLAAIQLSRLKELLAAGGSRFSIADPTSWPAQAKLAAEQRWDEFKALQASLRGGRATP